MEVNPPVFETEILLRSSNKPSQYRKDPLRQEIIACSSKFFEKDGRFIISAVRKESIEKSYTYVLYLYLFERYSPVWKQQKIVLDSKEFDFNKVFVQFTEHGKDVVVLFANYSFFFIKVEWCYYPLNIDEKPTQNILENTPTKSGHRSSRIKVESSSTLTMKQPAFVGLIGAGKPPKLPKEIISFLLWTSKNNSIGIIVTRDGTIIFFDLQSSTIVKQEKSMVKAHVKEAMVCYEDSNVNKVSTFLVIVYEGKKDITTVCCQQLEVKSLTSSECINIFSKDIDVNSLTRFIIEDKGDVQVHYFNNKTCLGFFHKMSLSLYSLYNQRLLFFDVCQSFPKSSSCFLNNKFLFQFSRLTDENHCCGIIPLMNLYDKTPQTQLINFEVDSNLFNIKGILPFYSSFSSKRSIDNHFSQQPDESSINGCVFWNGYCITIIRQEKPKEAVFCHKFLNSTTKEQEQSVISLYSITQSVDSLIQTVTKYYVEIGEIEKAQRLCNFNKTISLPLVKLNLLMVEYAEKEFIELINNFKTFISSCSKMVDCKLYQMMLFLVTLAKVIKFYIKDDEQFISILDNCTKENAIFILPYLYRLHSHTFEKYILLLLKKYPELIENYVSYVKLSRFNFIDFTALLECPIHIFELFQLNPTLQQLQILHENLSAFDSNQINELINFLGPESGIHQSLHSIFYETSFIKKLYTIYFEALILQCIHKDNFLGTINDSKNLLTTFNKFDEIYFDEVIAFANHYHFYALSFMFLVTICGYVTEGIQLGVEYILYNNKSSISIKEVVNTFEEMAPYHLFQKNVIVSKLTDAFANSDIFIHNN
ncbi:Mic1 domain-containing protein [Entamoeba marina]